MSKPAMIQPPPNAAEGATGPWRQPKALLRHLEIDHAPLDASVDTASDFPMRLTDTLASRIQPGRADDPILRQFLPTQAERDHHPGDTTDPVGDHAALGEHGVLRKYHGRALVMLTGACAVHCRYCFRRHMDYSAHATGHQAAQALAALAADTTVSEVILSGGDPLSLSEQRLCDFVAGLARVTHVRTIRLHSRSIVADPGRVTPGWITALAGSGKRIVVVTHVNHANELGSQADAALSRLRQAGFQLLNQAVLLRGVNDTADAQVALSQALFDRGVLPYYLHALDPVAGARHFAVDDERALALMDAVRANLPGYLVPRLVREDAGAASKQPVTSPRPPTHRAPR